MMSVPVAVALLPPRAWLWLKVLPVTVTRVKNSELIAPPKA